MRNNNQKVSEEFVQFHRSQEYPQAINFISSPSLPYVLFVLFLKLLYRHVGGIQKVDDTKSILNKNAMKWRAKPDMMLASMQYVPKRSPWSFVETGRPDITQKQASKQPAVRVRAIFATEEQAQQS